MRCLRFLLLALPCLVVAAGSAHAEIRDNGRIFSADAIIKAKATIAEIEKLYHRRVVVETYSEIPSGKLKEYDSAGKDKAAKAKFFTDWTHEREKADGASGVFVLICKQPGHVEVAVSSETRKKDFSIEDRNELRSHLVDAFREKKFDEGLLLGLDFIENTMKAHQGIKTQPEVAKPSATPAIKVNHDSGGGMSIMGMVCIIGGIVLFFWIASAVIRAFSNMGRNLGGGTPGVTGGPGYVGGGGGFMSNFMGGMFGSMAGSWMYNNFFGGGHSSGMHWDNPTSGGGDFGDSGGRDDRFDSGSAGGDFGDNDAGGGGDFGGDSGGGGGFFGGGGGGDFGGGGDSGGGGGDFGGGGGDF